MGNMIKKITDIKLISASIMPGGNVGFSCEILKSEDMLEQKDLRVGNLADHLYAPDLFRHPGGWMPNIIKVQDIVDIEKFPDNYRPIPLTEEWLIRFGFEEVSKDTWHKESFFIEFDIQAGFGFNIENNQGVHLLTGIEYVHELQNLYFALTGEELQIKEK